MTRRSHATTGNVTRLVLWQSLRVVAAGLVAGGGLAGSLATIDPMATLREE